MLGRNTLKIEPWLVSVDLSSCILHRLANWQYSHPKDSCPSTARYLVQTSVCYRFRGITPPFCSTLTRLRQHLQHVSFALVGHPSPDTDLKIFTAAFVLVSPNGCLPLLARQNLTHGHLPDSKNTPCCSRGPRHQADLFFAVTLHCSSSFCLSLLLSTTLDGTLTLFSASRFSHVELGLNPFSRTPRSAFGCSWERSQLYLIRSGVEIRLFFRLAQVASPRPRHFSCVFP